MTKSIEEIRKIKKDIEPGLLEIPGVTGVAIGKKIVDGQKQDEIGISVFVDKKKKEDEIPDTELIPKEKNGVKIDVVQLKPKPTSDSQANIKFDRTVVDRLKGGINIGTPVEIGTLGAIAIDNTNGQTLILSSCHVLAPTPTSMPGLQICNPADDPSHVVATLKSAKINSSIDAGVATVINPAVECTIEGIGPVKGVVEQNELPNMLGAPVKKRGIRTQVTTGTIEFIDYDFTIPYQHGLGTFQLNDQIMIKPSSGDKFSLEGDSGACILDGSNRVVGLLLGGDINPQSDGLRFSYANHIRPILDEFNISICTG